MSDSDADTIKLGEACTFLLAIISHLCYSDHKCQPSKENFYDKKSLNCAINSCHK